MNGADRRTDRRTDRQIDRQTERQTDKQRYYMLVDKRRERPFNIFPSIYLLQNDYLLHIHIQTITAIHKNIILLCKMNILYLHKLHNNGAARYIHSK